MTIDDDSSIYVGGLPYDATEDTIRTVFNLYGAILDVKIIIDQRTQGKCYCFVTFTNPRSALDAINDMNGRSICGRVVKVNGVKTRAGGRSNFGRERHYYHNDERNGDWNRSRDRGIRDQDYDHGNEKDGYRNRDRDFRDQDYDHGNERDGYKNRGGSDLTRHRDRSREHDRSRDHDRDRDRRLEYMQDYDQHSGDVNRDRRVEHMQDYDQHSGDVNRDRRVDHMHDYDQHREGMLDDDWDREDDRAGNEQDSSRVHSGVVDRDRNLDLDTDRKMDRISDPEKSFNEQKKEQPRRNIDLNVTNQSSPSDSNGDHNEEVEDKLELLVQRLDQLKKEVSQLEEGLEEKRLNVMELQKHSKKLEDAVITAKKQTSYRRMQLTNLRKCILQVQGSKKRLQTREKELQALVDSIMSESNGDGVGVGQLTNGGLDGR